MICICYTYEHVTVTEQVSNLSSEHWTNVHRANTLKHNYAVSLIHIQHCMKAIQIYYV